MSYSISHHPIFAAQVISLELQNAELLKLLRARGATAASSASSPSEAAATATARREIPETSQMRP